MGQVIRIGLVGLLLAGCATREMREHANVMVRAGEQLERETAAFAAARTGVAQLRQRSLVEQRAEVATRGQQNAATLAQWRVAKTEDRTRRVALFEGVRAASEAMYEVRDQDLAWEDSVLATRTALAIDRGALHRFVLQLVRLAQPGRFVDEVKFYAEYGSQVGAKVGGELQEVLSEVEAAEEAADGDERPAIPGTPTQPTQPPGPSPVTPTDPTKPADPRDPRPNPPTGPIGPTQPPTDPRPNPGGPDDLKLPTRSNGAPGTLGGPQAPPTNK